MMPKKVSNFFPLINTYSSAFIHYEAKFPPKYGSKMKWEYKMCLLESKIIIPYVLASKVFISWIIVYFKMYNFTIPYNLHSWSKQLLLIKHELFMLLLYRCKISQVNFSRSIFTVLLLIINRKMSRPHLYPWNSSHANFCMSL